jgi:hypothetical protein
MEPHHANHYTHFLRRLDRVEEDHLELAMALYADHELLRLVLERAKVPAGAERVAISLDSRHDGPFVVVTRTGAFVTCLGKHMRPGEMPIVTRPEIEAAGRHLAHMREKLDRVRQLREEQARGGASWLAELDLGRPMLAREDFENIQRWDPIFGRRHHVELVRSMGVLHEALRDLVCIRGDERARSRRDEKLLEAAWPLLWTVSNLHVIANVGDVGDRVAEFDRVAADMGVSTALFSSIAPTGGIPLVQTTARAVWASMRHVETMVNADFEHGVTTPSGYTMGDVVLVAIAIGSACSRERALAKLRARHASAHPCDVFHGELKPFFLDSLRDPEQAIDDFTLRAQERIAIERGGDPRDVPADVARALAVTGAADWNADPVARQGLAQSVAWLSVADASELFVPRAWCKDVRYTEQAALAIVRGVGNALQIGRPKTVRRAPTPERNDRCACGSGQKYKRCCMRVPLAA